MSGGCNIYVSRFFPHHVIELCRWWAQSLWVCACVCTSISILLLIQSMEWERAMDSFLTCNCYMMISTMGCFIRMKKNEKKNKTENYEATSTKRFAWAHSRSQLTLFRTQQFEEKGNQQKIQLFPPPAVLLNCVWKLCWENSRKRGKNRIGYVTRSGKKKKKQKNKKKQRILSRFSTFFPLLGGCLNFGI